MSKTGTLHAACEEGDLDAIKELLNDSKVRINKLIQKQTCLYAACAKGHTDAVKILLTHEKIDVNKGKSSYSGWGQSQTERFTSPLFAAVEAESFETVELLLQRDDIDVNKGYGIVYSEKKELKLPLHMACEKNNRKIVILLLLQKGVDIDTKYYDKKPEDSKTKLEIKNLFYEYRISKGKFKKKFEKEVK